MTTGKYIVSTSDFVGEIFIAGLENGFGGVCQNICNLRDKYEPLYLSKILGYGFYQDVLANVSDPQNVPDEYVKLINGTDYTLPNGHLAYWEGLRKHTAQYIYYWYMRMDANKTSAAGQSTTSVENAALTGAWDKMVTAYNSSVLGYRSVSQYLNIVRTDENVFPVYESSATDHCFNKLMNHNGF